MNTEKGIRHYEESHFVPASPEEVFAYIDDHKSFSSHMNESSWMMGGGKMTTSVDEQHGQAVGSHIKMEGKVFGFTLALDEVVTVHEPPHIKVWKTVGTPKLLIIGHYQMKAEIMPENSSSNLTVSIVYELPSTNAWLGTIFGAWYAKWCVQQMLFGTVNHFTRS